MLDRLRQFVLARRCSQILRTNSFMVSARLGTLSLYRMYALVTAASSRKYSSRSHHFLLLRLLE